MTRMASLQASLVLASMVAVLADVDAMSPACAQATSQSGPAFVDERRLPQDGAAAARQRESDEAMQRLKTEAEDLRKKLAQEEEARRKAEEEAAAKRAAVDADADAKRKADEAAAAQRAEAERRAKAASDADADAKRKADEAAAAQRAEAERQAKAAADADAKRKADEAAAAQRAEVERQAKAAADADSKRKADEAAAAQRAAAEAVARRKAEEAAAAQRAEAERQAKAAADANSAREAEAKSKAAAAAIAARMAPNQPCSDVDTDSKMLPGATVEITIKSACLAGKKVVLNYGAHSFGHTIPASGEAVLNLDLFEGPQPAALVMPDGQRAVIDTSAADLSQISKVAVIWSAPVNLDLHALEYLAQRGGAGHVWSGAPSSREQAGAAARDGVQGRGFMSKVDDGTGEGSKVEVYTFWHKAGQRSGAVTLFIDHASRGDTPSGDFCGDGARARVEATVVRLRPGGKVENEIVRLGPAVCGQKLRDAERYNPDTLSHLLAKG